MWSEGFAMAPGPRVTLELLSIFHMKVVTGLDFQVE